MNLLAAVLMQLPRPDQIDQEIAEGWTDNQASLKRNLAECLLPPSLKSTNATVSHCFPVWKTIKIHDDIKVDLVKVSLAELGFTSPTTYFDICDRATKQCNLSVVNREIVWRLRDQYTNQPEGERLYICEEPSTDREGMLEISTVKYIGHIRQIGVCGIENVAFNPKELWVFGHLKQKSVQAEEISSYVATSTLRNSTTIMAHVVKVGDQYFEILTPAIGPYNDLEPNTVSRITVKQVTLCPATALAIERAK